jgi:hypothetical protein
MSENPFNRVNFDPMIQQWIVVLAAAGDSPITAVGVDIATRSAFATEADARHYADSVNPVYRPTVAMTVPAK